MKTKNIGFIIYGLFVFFMSTTFSETKFIQITLPNGFKVMAELAITEDQRQLGLMFREKMREDQGMLFIFEEEDYYSFWMKNMRFSLDMLWLDSQRRIVHIEENVPPCSSEDCPSYGPALPARYVLELVSGSVKKHKLKLGDRLDFILPFINYLN
ncbi:MAG: DUF192 domain-containing protein [Candidatus Aminicenantes bacterium]|nr:DUF192 domain-containing protein [Candidatus Aminicenantes bacterium]